MARYAAGDVEAFEELYARYDRRVYGFCLHNLRDPDAAADAFQDTFRRLVESRDRYEGRGRFASWLFTLARRACADRFRRRPEARSLDAASRGEALPEALHAPGPEESAVARTSLDRLLARLPRGQREVLLLSKHFGFSYREVAEMTGTTEAAVKQKVYRALKTLRSGR